jgi:phage gp36-like protein
MSYATLADLLLKLEERELVQLTDDADLGVVNTGVVDAALEAADVEIDGYLGSKYTLPLAVVPGVIKIFAADIAIYNLFCRRNGPPEHWVRTYSNHIHFFTKVAGGEITLGQSAPDAGSNGVQVSSAERIFSRDSLKGF